MIQLTNGMIVGMPLRAASSPAARRLSSAIDVKSKKVWTAEFKNRVKRGQRTSASRVASPRLARLRLPFAQREQIRSLQRFSVCGSVVRVSNSMSVCLTDNDSP